MHNTKTEENIHLNSKASFEGDISHNFIIERFNKKIKINR